MSLLLQPARHAQQQDGTLISKAFGSILPASSLLSQVLLHCLILCDIEHDACMRPTSMGKRRLQGTWQGMRSLCHSTLSGPAQVEAKGVSRPGGPLQLLQLPCRCQSGGTRLRKLPTSDILGVSAEAHVGCKQRSWQQLAILQVGQQAGGAAGNRSTAKKDENSGSFCFIPVLIPVLAGVSVARLRVALKSQYRITCSLMHSAWSADFVQGRL